MAEEKRYFFIKPDVEYITQNPSLMKLRRCDYGSDLVIIYHKMVAKSLPEAGYIYFQDTLDDFVEDFAIVYGEDPALVKATIDECIRIRLIIIDEDHMYLKKVPELVESVTDAAIRKAKSRAKHKENQQDDDKNCSDTPVTVDDIDVTACDNVTDSHKVTHREEKRREENIREENIREENIREENIIDIYKSTQERVTTPYQQIMDLFNKTCPSLPQVKTLTKKRKKLIKDRYKEYSLADFLKVFEAAERSPFLKGQNNNSEHANWRATLDFLLAEDKFVKCLEGGYSSFGSSKPKQTQEMEEWYKMVSGWASEEEPPDDNSG